MKSARDLFEYTLENAMGVAGVAQPVQEEDVTLLRNALPSLLSLLRRREIADIRYNPNDEAYESIPDEALSPLAYLLANEVAPAYGRPRADGDGQDMLLWGLARALSNPPRYYQQTADYF